MKRTHTAQLSYFVVVIVVINGIFREWIAKDHQRRRWDFPFAVAETSSDDGTDATTTSKEQCIASAKITTTAAPTTVPISIFNEVSLVGLDTQSEHRYWKKNPSSDQQSVFYVLDEAKHLWYVPGFVNKSIATEIISSFCHGRFVRSPIRGLTDHNTMEHEIRTSESCTLIPAAIYRLHPTFLAQRHNPEMAQIARQVDVAWEIAEHISLLLGGSVYPASVEPLQVVRYTTPNAFYQVHHDHGGYYGKVTEQRIFTILVYLNDVLEGGHTFFPKFNMRIKPRFCDAVVWSNVNLESGEVDEDMIHAGEPPSREGIERYAINTWVKQ